MKAPPNSSRKFDEDQLRADYAAVEPVYRELCREARYILEQKLARTEIKIHGIEDRVKTLDSLLKKASERECKSPLDEIHDIAALRLICLFRDDLEKLEALINSNFVVQSKDDKIESGGALGYQSIHFVCTLPNTVAGPRYDHIVSKKFEVQIRTLCMHCWATVSHYIDYKGDWDVPNDLKNSLNALSGLFFVADNEFQQFSLARLQSKRVAEVEVKSKPSVDTEINFDTISAYMKTNLADRRQVAPKLVSDLVLDVKKAGYQRVSEVDADVKRALSAFEAYESETRNAKAFSAVGVIRLSLVLASETFSANYFAKSSSKNDFLLTFRKLVGKRAD